jgi:hypothetical protein
MRSPSAWLHTTYPAAAHNIWTSKILLHRNVPNVESWSSSRLMAPQIQQMKCPKSSIGFFSLINSIVSRVTAVHHTLITPCFAPTQTTTRRSLLIRYLRSGFSPTSPSTPGSSRTSSAVLHTSLHILAPPQASPMTTRLPLSLTQGDRLHIPALCFW